jgi:hypothetical protein
MKYIIFATFLLSFIACTTTTTKSDSNMSKKISIIGTWCDRFEGSCFEFREGGKVVFSEDTSKTGSWLLDKNKLILKVEGREDEVLTVFRLDEQGLTFGKGEGMDVFIAAYRRDKPTPQSAARIAELEAQIVGKWSIDSMVGVPQEGFDHDIKRSEYVFNKDKTGQYGEQKLTWKVNENGDMLLMVFDGEHPSDFGFSFSGKDKMYLSFTARITHGEFIAVRK